MFLVPLSTESPIDCSNWPLTCRVQRRQTIQIDRLLNLPRFPKRYHCMMRSLASILSDLPICSERVESFFIADLCLVENGCGSNRLDLGSVAH